jgi:hypothetical protein
MPEPTYRLVVVGLLVFLGVVAVWNRIDPPARFTQYGGYVLDTRTGRTYSLDGSPYKGRDLRSEPNQRLSDHDTIRWSVGQGSPWLEYNRIPVVATVGIILAGLLGWRIGEGRHRLKQ